MAARAGGAPLEPDVVEQGDDEQGEHGGDEDSEDQEISKPVEDRIIEDEHRPEHRRQRGERDRLGPHRRRFDDRAETPPASEGVVDEIDEQDRVAHDDPRKRDHPDHAGRGELGAEQRVAGHDPDHGERDRRHDDQRHEGSS